MDKVTILFAAIWVGVALVWLTVVWGDRHVPKYLVVVFPDAEELGISRARAVEIWAFRPFGLSVRKGALGSEHFATIVTLLEAPKDPAERCIEGEFAGESSLGIGAQVPQASRKALWRLLRDDERERLSRQKGAGRRLRQARRDLAQASAVENRQKTLTSLRAITDGEEDPR